MMDFETWWEEIEDRFLYSREAAEAAWQAAQEAEREKPCKRCIAYKNLVQSLESQITHHRKKANEYFAAIATLDSERQANEKLTNELEKRDGL